MSEHDEERDTLMERVNEAEAQCRAFGEMFTRQGGLIRDLYALLAEFEALGKQALWEGRKVEPTAIKALLAQTPDEANRLADPKYRTPQEPPRAG